MSQWQERVQTLRKVRQACREFLLLWATETTTQSPTTVADDLVEQELADPFNNDWSLLYRGSVLDD